MPDALKKVLLSLFPLLLLAGDGLAGENPDAITIYGKRIPNILEGGAARPFDRFLEKLSRQSDNRFLIRIYPAKRATALFAQGEADILIPFPVSAGHPDPFARFPSPVLASHPILQLSRHVLTLPPEMPVIGNYEQLSGRRIGVALGYEYNLPASLRQNANLFQAESQVSLIKMLYRGRVDAVISFPFEAGLVARKLEYSPLPQFDPDFSVSRSGIVMLFHDTPRGQKIRNLINQGIMALRKDGAINKLYRAFGQPVRMEGGDKES